MADYPIISDVSNHLIRLLREQMCPEPIPAPNSIAIATPIEQDADYLLGLYLYDIREDGEISTPPMIGAGMTRLRRPPKPYSLYYMLYLNASSQMGMKGGDLQKVIGRAAQAINDASTVLPRTLQPWLERDEPPIVFSPARLTLEDKTRVWTAVNKPYQVALFYRASPILLSSQIVVDPPRVTEARFALSVQGEERGEG